MSTNAKSSDQASWIAFALFSIFVSITFTSCTDWIVPKPLVGTWSSTTKATVRFKEGAFSFKFVSDTVAITMTIYDDGKVSGTVGGAKMEGCSVIKNRGALERKLNMATDYSIRGKLIGNIFPQDTITRKGIKMPFNLTDNMLKGSLFQQHGIDIFPMVDIQLTKKS